ncbi:hypothetical protein ARMGADRAFT_116582 [Armillaria gallica]|uniref:Uncharacterized protein n=1 Tax=Armillaria gallica TaxID=47427 RepID=A0A2H3DFV2_ARMGA|nr:hypothetical protein ARMGADRAFT_116582 [Armillaria gallica]
MGPHNFHSSPPKILWADQWLCRPTIQKDRSTVKLPGRHSCHIVVVDSTISSASSSLLRKLNTNVGGRTVDCRRYVIFIRQLEASAYLIQ